MPSYRVKSACQGELFNDNADHLSAGKLAFPILEKREDVKPQKGKDVELIGFKCACGSVWCPDCYSKKGLSKRFTNRLQEMNWDRVRQVILTVDPKKFPGMSPQEVFEFLQHDRKAVSSFLRDLQRTQGIEVTDWAWVMEWHETGLPHWHVFIERPDKGRASMIGNANLLKSWRYGIPREERIHSQRHWGNFTGYFGGNGYFKGESKKDKSHQLELPVWAKKVTYNIRKTDSMRRKKADQEPKDQEPKDQEPKDQEPKKTYGEILSSCGKSTMIQVRERGKSRTRWQGESKPCWMEFFIPYKSFREMSGEYVEGVGYVVHMTYDEFQTFLNLERSMLMERRGQKGSVEGGFVASYSGEQHDFDSDFLFGEMAKYNQEKAAQRMEEGCYYGG